MFSTNKVAATHRIVRGSARLDLGFVYEDLCESEHLAKATNAEDKFATME